MPDAETKYRIFISVAEPSADVHCAGLITALRQSGYDIDFVGVGGPKMASAGCHLLEITIGRAVMIYNAFAQIAHYYKLIRRITRYLKSNEVDLVIVCDSPSFNFHIAKAAKKAGIKTSFYVAPQLWAWGGWRIRKLRKYCDKLCCILPFEQDWFGQRGVDTVFVGNPLLDQLGPDFARYKKDYAGFDANAARFAIMPGSRTAELKSLWRPMQQIAMRLKEKHPSATFVTVALDEKREQSLKAAQIEGFECEYTVGTVSETAREVDFAIVASGSATLQVATAGCPMVVMYQSSRVLWHLFGRWLVKAEYLSLVNCIAGRELVPEFMPYFSSIDPIVENIERFIEDTDSLAQLSSELVQLAEPLGAGSASEKVARIVVEMLGK
ncbi:MAG: lipid-A-disaccharide synthase [Planctomycetota bacterium]|jgi:lipid-A-disaccharide synthase